MAVVPSVRHTRPRDHRQSGNVANRLEWFPRFWQDAAPFAREDLGADMYWSSPLLAKAVMLGLVEPRRLARLARRVQRRGQ